jgi:hypothetical protein
MLVFLDTEFTNFVRPDLISIALVSEDGQEFYAERTDYCRADCGDFVRETVQPLLGCVPGAACSRSELTDRVCDWFTRLTEPATIFLVMSGTGTCWPSPCLTNLTASRPVTSPTNCISAHTPSHTRSLSRYRVTSIPKTGPHTMHLPMRGRSWLGIAPGTNSCSPSGGFNNSQ